MLLFQTHYLDYPIRESTHEGKQGMKTPLWITHPL